jgi:hypothetical protein
MSGWQLLGVQSSRPNVGSGGDLTEALNDLGMTGVGVS